MLVLTRKLMEKLYIGDEICVTVVRLEGGQVRLGIEAPRTVSVVRAELIDGRARTATAPGRRVNSEVVLSATPTTVLEPLISLHPNPGSSPARGIGIQRRVPSR